MGVKSQNDSVQALITEYEHMRAIISDAYKYQSILLTVEGSGIITIIGWIVNYKTAFGLFLLTPFVIFISIMAINERRKIVDGGQQLYVVERRINEALQREVMSWETYLRNIRKLRPSERMFVQLLFHSAVTIFSIMVGYISCFMILFADFPMFKNLLDIVGINGMLFPLSRSILVRFFFFLQLLLLSVCLVYVISLAMKDPYRSDLVSVRVDSRLQVDIRVLEDYLKGKIINWEYTKSEGTIVFTDHFSVDHNEVRGIMSLRYACEDKEQLIVKSIEFSTVNPFSLREMNRIEEYLVERYLLQLTHKK